MRFDEAKLAVENVDPLVLAFLHIASPYPISARPIPVLDDLVEKGDALQLTDPLRPTAVDESLQDVVQVLRSELLPAVGGHYLHVLRPLGPAAALEGGVPDLVGLVRIEVHPTS